MAKRESIFGDEWRRCLKEHYKYVVRQQDKITKDSLTPIMNRFGFGEDDLHQLYLDATIRDMPQDFVPDMERVISQAEQQAEETTFKTHPAECTCPACMELVLEAGHDEEGQPLEPPEEPEVAQGNLFIVPKPKADDDRDELPKQLSLF